MNATEQKLCIETLDSYPEWAEELLSRLENLLKPF